MYIVDALMDSIGEWNYYDFGVGIEMEGRRSMMGEVVSGLWDELFGKHKSAACRISFLFFLFVYLFVSTIECRVFFETWFLDSTNPPPKTAMAGVIN